MHCKGFDQSRRVGSSRNRLKSDALLPKRAHSCTSMLFPHETSQRRHREMLEFDQTRDFVFKAHLENLEIDLIINRDKEQQNY